MSGRYDDRSYGDHGDRHHHVNNLVTWYQYQVQIHHVKREPQVDENGKVLKDKQGEILCKYTLGRRIFDERDTSQESEEIRARQAKRNRTATHFSRRILRKLQQEHGLKFVTDGASLAVAPQRLPGLSTNLDDRPQRKARKEADSAPGIYGPADPGKSGVAPSQDAVIKPWKVFPPFRVRRDCDEDDPKAEHSIFQWCQVKLTEVGTIQFQVGKDGSIRHVSADENLEPCLQAVDLAVNNAMLGKMLQLRTMPNAYFFKCNPFENNPKLRLDFQPECMPLYGLLQTAKFTESGAFLCADLGLGWQRPETHNNGPIRILVPDRQGYGGTLAGVRLEDLRRPVPEHQRQDVHKALSFVTFHVAYRCGKAWVENQMKWRKDPDSEKVKRDASRGCRNKRMSKKGDNENIVWAADDAALYSFPFKAKNSNGEFEEERAVTVSEYYDIRYDIPLRFPKMPMVRISAQEVFPVEFLLQAQGPAAKGNNDRKTALALRFNDEYACDDRIRMIQELLGMEGVYKNLTETLKLLNINLATTPLTLKAKVLPFPRLVSARGEYPISNGSWNLIDAEFRVPATLHSFAVVNLAGDAGKNPELPRAIFGALQKYGVKLPLFEPSPNEETHQPRPHTDPLGLWEYLRVDKVIHPQRFSEQSIKEAFDDALWRTNDVMNKILSQKLCFQTIAKVDRGGIMLDAVEVVVIPQVLASNEAAERPPDGHFAVMECAQFKKGVTHEVVLRDGTEAAGWLMYELQFQNKPIRLTPGEVRFYGRIQVFHPEQGWIDVLDEHQIKPVIWANDHYYDLALLQSHRLLRTGQEENQLDKKVSFVVERVHIECPSLAFVVLPSKDTSLYHHAKRVAYVDHGVNSQTIVMESFLRNKRNPSFSANIALKTNCKLATMKDNACAWSLGDREHTWLDEVPTLVVGLATASEQGQGSNMIVVGTAYLDAKNRGQTCCYEARGQPKSPLISPEVLRGIFYNLFVQFGRYNMASVKRLVVIRSGGHDGIFDDILRTEVPAIRQAFLDVEAAELGKTDLGRDACPVVTLLVAQSAHHNIRLVPLQHIGGRSNNVPSGTCVDSPQVVQVKRQSIVEHEEELRAQNPGQLQLFRDPTSRNSDFFLVPHGGLKGTSNGVLYRVILNENHIFSNDANATPLSTPTLQSLVYELSYIYSKATKAPRDCALTKTSQNLANIVLGIVSSMGREAAADFFPKNEDGTASFTKDNILRAFGPFNGNAAGDTFRPHVYA